MHVRGFKSRARNRLQRAESGLGLGERVAKSVQACHDPLVASPLDLDDDGGEVPLREVFGPPKSETVPLSRRDIGRPKVLLGHLDELGSADVVAGHRPIVPPAGVCALDECESENEGRRNKEKGKREKGKANDHPLFTFSFSL